MGLLVVLFPVQIDHSHRKKHSLTAMPREKTADLPYRAKTFADLTTFQLSTCLLLDGLRTRRMNSNLVILVTSMGQRYQDQKQLKMIRDWRIASEMLVHQRFLPKRSLGMICPLRLLARQGGQQD